MSNQIKVNRWLVFASAWIIIFMLSSVAIFSVFSAPMTEMYGWSKSQFTLAYSMYTIIFAIVAIFAGVVTDKRGSKSLMYIGGVLFGIGWFTTGMVHNLTQLYIAYSLIAGAGAGMMYNSALATALRWFPDKGGKISGLLLSSAAIGPFILSPISNYLIEHYGVLASFKILGVVYAVAILAVGWMLNTAPAGYKPKGWEPPAPSAKQAAAGVKDYNWRQMLATPSFYILLLTLVCASTAGTMMVSSASVISQEQVHLTATMAALIVSISTLANFVGRLSFGVIYDKLGDYKALLVSLVLTIAALIMISMATNTAFFIICIILLGFAFGGLLVVFPPMTSRSFGARNLGLNYAIVFLGYAGGSYVGPKIASYYRDTTGSFTTAYIVSAVLTAIGIVLVGVLLYLNKRSEAGRG